MSNLFDKTTDALATSIAMRQIRHNVTSANIANADTPNYHAKTSHGEHFGVGGMPAVSPGIYENPDVAVNNDGNTVDLEREMSALAENSVMYKTALQLINKKMAAMKYAISETR
jgi:flagellar basal-body rod protein FlgB